MLDEGFLGISVAKNLPVKAGRFKKAYFKKAYFKRNMSFSLMAMGNHWRILMYIKNIF